MKLNRKIIESAAGILLLLAGFVGGIYTHEYMIASRVPARPLRENSSGFNYINPLLLSVDTGPQKSPEYASLHDSLAAYVKNTISVKNAENVSVYFRDLNSGSWTGVNEDDTYNPASMLKIAVLIATLRLAEKDPALLDDNITMSAGSSNQDFGQFYPPKNPILPGKVYTVRQLITAMIVESDNNADGLLIGLIGRPQFEKVLNDLQLPVNTSGTINSMSPKLYSRLYRVLYNSTYLSHELSEQTLELLIQKDFTKGLYAGLPANISVAQKFGERTITDSNGTPIERELHDCGIVYYPKAPYFVCVMTRGQDFIKLQSIISDISKISWDGFTKLH